MRGLTAIRLTPPQLAGKYVRTFAKWLFVKLIYGFARTLWFINTHFQYDNETTRQGAATELVQYVQNLALEFPEYVLF